MNTTISQKIISDFSKTLSKNKKEKSEKIVKGKIIGINNEYYVRLCDYSEDSKEFSSSINIPLKSTANIDITKPVNVLIKNHTAIVIGNINDNSNDKYNLNDDNKYAHWECVDYGRDLAKWLGCEIKEMEEMDNEYDI